MFSSRLHWDLQPNSLSKALAAKRAAGAALFDLTESNPTSAQLDYPVDAIVAAFADPALLRYDPNPAGMQSAREAVSEYYDGLVAPGNILLTTSTSEAYGLLFKLLTDPGDEVLVPRPSYPLFEFLAGMELVRVVPYPLDYQGTWRIDFDALTEAASERTRAVVVVNPNNPTGSFLQTGELDQLEAFCADRDLAIISDEVFADYGFELAAANRITSLTGVPGALTFCLSGLSKIAGMPQMKLGWIATAGPAHLRNEAMAHLELIADTYLSVGTPVQIAARKLLEIGAGIRSQIRTRTVRNLAALQTAITPDSPFRVLNVEGGWYATLQVPRLRTEEEWVLGLLEKRNVLVQPGFFYDFETEGLLVLSLLTPPAVFDEGVARILAFDHS